jgi:EAL and modified HD-GYP domain-containing signal transduction protein
MNDILIGRQQIFDQHLNIYAYELLFRGDDFDLNLKDGATKATNQVITDTILEIGLNTIVGQHKAFINFTTQNILDKTPLALPKDRIVVEVLESVEINDNIVSNLKELSDQGYIIALDDFVFSDDWTPLVEFADIIKLDIMEMGETKTRELITRLKSYNVKLLAEKIESYAEYQYLLELGCEYFQGFFFNKPNIVSGKRVSVNQTSAIKLLNTVNNPDVEFDDLAKIISLDIGLSYKLLHYINSAFFALPKKVSSINHAISYLGLKEIKRWINILTLASLSNKPEAVMQNALIRGKMCEELAQLSGDKSDNFFLIGILSSLDSLLDMHLDEALEQLPLSDETISAILDKKGPGGEALKCVISYEHWDISLITFKNIDQSLIGAAYIKSISWAKDIMSNIK